jgi:dTDP-4-dehydrorhamnose 3,5-epimerase
LLKWIGLVLSRENCCSLVIPEGFAHGFQVLEPDAEILYLHSAPYSAEHEGALNALDPRIGIAWPLEISELSHRDRAHPYVTSTFSGLFL